MTKLSEFIKDNDISFNNLMNPKKLLSIVNKTGFMTFVSVGLMGLFIHVFLTWFLTTFYFKLENYFYAYLISLVVNLIFNFILHTLKTFKTKDQHLKRLMLFMMYSFSMAFVQALTIRTLTSLLGLEFYLIVITSVVVFFSIVTFLFFKLYIFKTKEKTKVSFLEEKHLLPLGILLFIIVVAMFFQFKYFQPLNQLPSPVYGGDYYFQKGSIEHLRDGGGIMQSSSLVDAMPVYMPLYGLLVSFVSDFLTIDTIKGMFLSSILLVPLTFLLWYLVFSILFKDSWIAILGSVVVVGAGQIIIKYTPFGMYIMTPLFLIALIRAYYNRTMLNYTFLGAILGILSLAHLVAFMGAVLITSFFFIFEVMNNTNKLSYREIKKYIERSYKYWLIFGVFAFVFAIIYWYKPLFVHHLDMSYYERSKMDFVNFSLFDVQISFLIGTLKGYIFSFGGLKIILLNLLTLGGLVTLPILKTKNNDMKKTAKFVKFFLIAAFITCFSYFLTEPLLGLNFIPTYMVRFYLPVALAFVSMLFLSLILPLIASLAKVNKEVLKKITVIVLVTIFFSTSISANLKEMKEDRWYSVGLRDLSPQYISLQKYLHENTKASDVILTTKELGFSVNSMRGNKIVAGRWAHNGDPYINLPMRDVEAAIIFYGNNVEEKKKLIKKYNIKYLYWEDYWIQSEFQFSPEGQLLGWFDPLLTLDKPEHIELLMRNDVKFTPNHYWLDPAVRREKVKKFDILLVTPNNYHNFTHPYSTDLDPFLKEVWNYETQGRKTARLFEIEV